MNDPVQRFLDAVAERKVPSGEIRWINPPSEMFAHSALVCTSWESAVFYANARTTIPVLLALLRKAIEQRDEIACDHMVETVVEGLGCVSASWHIHRLNAELAALLPKEGEL